MKKSHSLKLFIIIMLFVGVKLSAQYKQILTSKNQTSNFIGKPAFLQLRFADIKPKGWILNQMERDLNSGFAGHLDELCNEASSDIFASGRNYPGKPNSGNVANVAWWNGETEGNWRCGQIMLACLTKNKAAMIKVKRYINHILMTQDADGYIGIFSPELRYKGNGELWTQTCLFRGMLAYADATNDEEVNKAVKRAVDRTIEGYNACEHIEFDQHDDMYTDILEILYNKTGDKKYLDFGLRLYKEYPGLMKFFEQPEVGGNFQNCLYKGHGASVTEAMRMPFWFWTATGNSDYLKLGKEVVSAMDHWVMPSGALVSQEYVDSKPQPWNVGYEYCTIFERENTLLNAGQKTGDATYFQAAEQLFFNAAQGSREPDGSAILYCSFENRLSIHDEIDRRQRFSPTHQQVAVCCNPNATRAAPYFIANTWMKPTGYEPAIAAMLYIPCEVNTEIKGTLVKINECTNYPYSGEVIIKINPTKEIAFCLWLRNPEWSKETKIYCEGAEIEKVEGFWKVRKTWEAGDVVTIRFDQSVNEVHAVNDEVALQYGPLLYVLPIKSEIKTIKSYNQSNLIDYNVCRVQGTDTIFSLPGKARANGFDFIHKIDSRAKSDYFLDKASLTLEGEMYNKEGILTSVTLVPMGSIEARLRLVTFSVTK